jgi:hypothetical protein
LKHFVLPFARLAGKNLQEDFDGSVLFLHETETQVGLIGRLVVMSM